jgi:hypothetical protein
MQGKLDCIILDSGEPIIIIIIISSFSRLWHNFIFKLEKNEKAAKVVVVMVMALDCKQKPF